MRLACDTGGTFTDLLVQDGEGFARMYKASTTPENPIDGVIAALELAAADHGEPLGRFLAAADTFIHGTTHAINAVVTGRTARTALLTTAGHPEVLVLREGGRKDPFEHAVDYPAPFVPRGLTFEITERIDSGGAIVTPLDEAAARATIEHLKELRIEAVACCLLWSISNPEHELRIGSLLDELLPGVPYTLSHAINPSLREYRRAISAALDASLKPTMTRYLGALRSRLADAGFTGRLLVQTSQGGMADAEALSRTPIHSLNSGPALAPVAGRDIARRSGVMGDVIVADTGGTTYDVSLVRGGRLPMTRETWIGPAYVGHMTGFPSVDVKSIGAGGGSIAWLDDAGLLRVGPASAGARPGPACFGRGGIEPTLTDAAVVLGYIDPEYFLGGSMPLSASAAENAIDRLARPLGVSRQAAALAIHQVATENMVQAILDLTVRQGIDPLDTVLIGGGGAAGLNSDAIGRRLGCSSVIIPSVGAALSAAGGLLSDVKTEARQTFYCSTAAFPMDAVNDLLDRLLERCRSFARSSGVDPEACVVDVSVEARYPNQVWEIDVPLAHSRFADEADLEGVRTAFHGMHRDLFGFDDRDSEVEIVTWCATLHWNPRPSDAPLLLATDARHREIRSRLAWFEGHSEAMEVPVYGLGDLAEEALVRGPALVETPFTTVVIEPGSTLRHQRDVGLVLTRGLRA